MSKLFRSCFRAELLAALLLSLGLSLGQPVAAQTPTTQVAPVLVPPAKAVSAPRPAAPDSGAVLVFNAWYLPRYSPAASGGAADTTGALLSLFRRRRLGGWAYAVPFFVGMCLALPIASTDQYGQRQVAKEAISPPVGSALLAATLGGFIVHARSFNKLYLLALDRAYAAGRPVPARYRRLLTAEHFAEAALLREALAQQKAREQAIK